MINGLDELLDLVNAQNDLFYEITSDNVVIGPPESLPPYAVLGQTNRNTSVKMTGIQYRGYQGETSVYYRRGDLDSLFVGLSPSQRTREAVSAASILDWVNLKYGLRLEMRDLQPLAVPPFESPALEDSFTVVLSVIEPSYRWVGTVTVEVIHGNPLITSVVYVQLLPILDHPDDLEQLAGRRSGQVQTWGFDFTAWLPRLSIDPDTGEWANFADVQFVGREAGIPAWYNSPVVDLPTEAVPGANSDYQRVMVQYPTLGDVKGPLYFHYDLTW